MTTTLSIAPAPFTGSTAVGRSGEAGAGADFGGVLDAEMGTAIRTAFRAARGSETAPSEAGTALAGELDALLTRLAEQLAALEEMLEDDLPPDADLLALVEGLMTRLRTALGEAGIVQRPGAAPGPIAGLRQGLMGGLDALPAELRQGLADKLDVVSGAANRLAGTLGEDALPGLDGFARLLDRVSAALGPTETPAHPDMLLKLARSETTQDAATTEPGKDSDQSPAEIRAQAALDGAAGTSAARSHGGGNGQAGGQSRSADEALAAMAGRSDKGGDTVVLPTAPQAPAPTTASAQAGPAAYVRPEAQVNMPFIAAEIARHVQNGTPRFEIRLNPPEMGRIDVRLEFDPSGNVTARLAVERSETLDLMQRDQRTLERMLAQAGLDSGRTNLEFSLRQNGSQGGGFGQAGTESGPSGHSEGPQSATETEQQRLPVALYRGYVRADAVNLWI